jgi:uncharacterized membrane protein YfcA
MGMENFAGYLASGLMGISLGLIGGGGSIITIPVLVYLFHIEPTLATAYSLFIVGITSMVGGIRNAFHKMVDLKSALLFSIPSTVAVYFTRHNMLSHVPESIVTIHSFTLTKEIAIMIFFSIVMLLASLQMIRDTKPDHSEYQTKQNKFFTIVLLGALVGFITGIVGAGGGFLIVPALVMILGLPMKQAIGTSLIIIAVNSWIGFIGDMTLVREINFQFMIVLSVLAVAGVFLGSYLAKFVEGRTLKSGFGWFALTTSIYILIKEIIV